MIKSMTGYGKAVAETSQKKITIEIKSLNSKQLDLSTKLPWIYKEKEPDVRNIISQMLNRGKIDVSIYFDVLEDEGIATINKSVVKNYYNQLKEITEELNINIDNQILPVIMRLPDALSTDRPELSEEEWNLLRKNLIDSINVLDLYRTEEGKSIEIDLRKRIAGILDSLSEIEKCEPGRIEKVREKLIAILKDHNGTENIDKNRFEQELIFYLEKFDINEEKVRLKKHCEYFVETIDNDAPNGKILSFIVQEMGREINTIGSKANDAGIQKLVVMMKDELEKIKEQTNNIL
jgi:uncharacterized protein (TIGR00255 family)